MKKSFASAFLLIGLLPVGAFARPFRTVQLKERISFMCFSPNLEQFAVIGTKAEIQLWDLRQGKLQHTLKSHIREPKEVVFSRDGKILASAGTDGIRVWDTRNGKLLRTLHNDMDYFSTVALSPDGRIVAAAGVEDPVCFWDVRSGKLKAERDPLFTSALSFAPNGKTYVVANYGGTKNGKRDMDITDVKTGKVMSKLRYIDNINAAAFSSDGKLVISAGSVNLSFAQVSVWDIKSKNLKRVLKWKGKEVRAVAMAPNSSEVATASDKQIRLWNLSNGKLAGTFNGHKSDVIALAFSRKDKILATVSSDGTVNLWRVK